MIESLRPMFTQRKRQPVSVGETLASLLAQLDPEGHLRVAHLIKLWPEVAGDQIARRTEIAELKFHTAVVKVSSPMWIQELNLLRPQILSRLIDALGDDSVRDIRFVRGTLSHRSIAKPRLVKRPIRRSIPLPDLKDPALREAFASLIEAWGRSSR
jgi:predicted nucleic acid-binding Zn ribbon protein